jgi:hypothetical protein
VCSVPSRPQRAAQHVNFARQARRPSRKSLGTRPLFRDAKFRMLAASLVCFGGILCVQSLLVCWTSVASLASKAPILRWTARRRVQVVWEEHGRGIAPYRSVTCVKRDRISPQLRNPSVFFVHKV